MALKRKLLELFGGPDMQKLLAALDERKTIIGLVLLQLPSILDAISQALSASLPMLSGTAAAHVVTVIGAIGTLVGIVHKLQKIATEVLK
jgi:hypothetical protein